MIKNNRRQNKIKKQISKQNNNDKLRRESYKRVLDFIKIDTTIIPYDFMSLIYSTTIPSINIKEDETDDPDIKKTIKIVSDKIRYRLNNEDVILDEEDKPYRLNDYITLNRLQQIFNSIYSEASTQSRKISVNLFGRTKIVHNDTTSICNNSKHIYEKLIKFQKKHEFTILTQIFGIIYEETLKYFDYNNGLYPELMLYRNNQIAIPLINIHILKSKLKQIHINNEIRKAHQCYIVKHPNGLTPITLDPKVIGNDKPLRVYIQDHALFRIKERLGIDPMGYVYNCIGSSMIDPVITNKFDNFCMIEYRYFSNKIGYLIVSIEDDIALIRSFKFITMSGTPEFNKLKKLLKGSREDFEYLGLDNLNTLLNSDIQNDTKLKLIFEKAGLGHLLGLADCNTPISVANDIKNYFRI